MTNPLSSITALLFLTLAAHAQETTVVTEKTETPVAVTETVEQTNVFTGTLSSVNIPLTTISLSTEASSSPVSYSYTEQTKFFDNEGHPLTPAALEPGAAVTLTYIQTGEKLIALKVVVAKTVVTTEVIVEKGGMETKPVVVTPEKAPVRKTKVKKIAPKVVEETKKTTTTTDR